MLVEQNHDCLKRSLRRTGEIAPWGKALLCESDALIILRYQTERKVVTLENWALTTIVVVTHPQQLTHNSHTHQLLYLIITKKLKKSLMNKENY